MTVRVTTLTGSSAGLYYVEHLPSYYLDGGEPPGRWRGRGAAALGLSGNVDDDKFVALMAGDHPTTGDPLGRRYGEKSVRGFDVTASAPKSVSILFATGDAAVRREVLEAHDTAVEAMADWIEAHAHTRYRINGEVAIVDAEGVIAAMFRQHTSRALDPQIHTHLVIPNRVRSPDGRWLALDARTIKLDQRTLSALYHATLRAELSHRLGIRWHEPEHGIAEIADVPDDLRTLYSSRTDAMSERLDKKLERFSDTFGREPTRRERWKLEREAAVESRPPKEHFPDAEALHATWFEQLEVAGWTRERLLEETLTPEPPARALDPATRELMTARALHELGEKQSTWRPAELVRELAAAVPTDVTMAAEELVPALDAMADEIVAERLIDLSRPIPEGVPLRRDGRPFTEAVIHRALTTPEIVAEEERLLGWAERRLDPEPIDRPVQGADALDGPQREFATAVAGDRQLVLAVGPAGTGKTAALRPAVEQLRADGRAVFGVTPSATAAEVLAVDTGVDADTLDKLLHEHQLDRPPDHRYDLPTGATVIVDEAAMVSTGRLAALADLAERREWRLALVGDPLQFSAVGRSGMFGYLADTYGAIEFEQVHRFRDPWEREASLRLRRGDLTVLEEYDERGRLHGGNRRRMQRGIVDAWWDAVSRGEAANMMAPTTEGVATLNRLAQQRRIDAEQIDPNGPSMLAQQYQIYVGDRVATRRNDRRLLTKRGLMVKNRDHWTVEKVHRDGSLTVDGRTGTVRLPADYVLEHVELAYAETSHANQGRTVDRSFLFLDGDTDTRGIYVPMTRGRHSNEAFVVLDAEELPPTSLPRPSPVTGSTSPPSSAGPNSNDRSRRTRTTAASSRRGSCNTSCTGSTSSDGRSAAWSDPFPPRRGASRRTSTTSVGWSTASTRRSGDMSERWKGLRTSTAPCGAGSSEGRSLG